MKPKGHCISSLAAGGLIYITFGNFTSALMFFISNFFIDLDHVFDYVRQFGLKNLSIRNLCDCCNEHKITKVTLVFHSFEIVLILWIFVFIYKLNIIWVSAALGFTFHLILDQFTNPIHIFSYFFIYRFLKRFKAEEIFFITES